MTNPYEGKSISEIREMIREEMEDQKLDWRLVVNGEHCEDDQVLKVGDVVAWRDRYGRDVIAWDIVED